MQWARNYMTRYMNIIFEETCKADPDWTLLRVIQLDPFGPFAHKALSTACTSPSLLDQNHNKHNYFSFYRITLSPPRVGVGCFHREMNSWEE